MLTNELTMRPQLKNRIFFKAFWLFATLVVSIISVIAFLVIPLQKQSLQKIMYTQAETVARSIVQASSDAMIGKDFGFIVEHNVKVLENNTGMRYVLIVVRQGEKIWVDNTGWKMLSQLDPKITGMQTDKITYQILNVSSDIPGYHFVYPIQFAGIEWGWLHIGFTMDDYNRYIHGTYLQIIYISGIALFLTIMLGYFFARWISKPITYFSELATKVAQGDLNVQSDLSRSDEIGLLSNNFNQMIISLRQSKERLQQYNQELEKDVKKRTEQLDLLNQGLDQKIKEEVAQRREQERLLIHQSRLAAMGEMVGAIAHQWRQPLNALGLVYQSTYMLYKSKQLTPELMERNAEKAKRLITKMSNTIDDFRNFFKPNKHMEAFSLKQIILSIIDLLDAVFKNHNIQVILESDEVTIMGFQGEFSQVMLNILNNAKDALIEKQIASPEIKINVRHYGANSIIVSVSDNAGGIPEAIMDKIYDPYFTTKQEGKGTGIGLYMSKIIIEKNMLGKLNAFNTEVGAQFDIEIPLTYPE